MGLKWGSKIVQKKERVRDEKQRKVDDEFRLWAFFWLLLVVWRQTFAVKAWFLAGELRLLCSSLSPLFLDCNFLSFHRNFALFSLAIKLCSSCYGFKEEKEKVSWSATCLGCD